MCNNQDCKCISDILKIINILQKKSKFPSTLDTCDKPVLGCPGCVFECNTRPVQLILCGGNGNDPLVMPTTKEPITETTVFSDVFRVEKVDDCCATFRVLVPIENPRPNKCPSFIATNSFFTLDLRCVCAIKCLDDTFVECV